MTTLLKNADILTLNGDEVVHISRGFLGIDGKHIKYVGKSVPHDSYDVEKDMSGKLLMPGLINSHGHSPMTLLRGLGSELPLERWLKEAMWPIEAKLDTETVRIGTRLALAEMISTGTTCFSDMYYMSEGSAEEVCSAKLKSNLTRALLAFDPDESLADNSRYQEFKSLYDNYDGYDDGRIRIDFSLHAEYTTTERVTREIAGECNDVGGHMHIHLSETAKEHNDCKNKYGKTPARWFADAGVFDSSCQAAHCVVVEDQDIDLLAEKGVTVIHNPSSNLKLGSGFAPIRKMMDKGINITIGTDGAASNNNLNLFEEVHLASLIHKGYCNDPTIIRPEELFKIATVNGAKMMRRDDIGSLEAGKRADIIAIDLDRPHLTPNFDSLALFAYSIQGSDVVMTMTDGEIIYENGVYHTIDMNELKADVSRALKRLYD